MSIYLINNIIVPLEEEADFRREALRALRCKGSDLLKVDIYRKSVDARKKENIRLNYTIAATLKEGVTLRENAKYRLLMEDKPQFRPGMEPMKHRPVIIGLGPAGMFCGLMLTRAGYQPVILEQGAPMEERVADVEAFWQEQRLDESSNIQFGEGGAGTFSDGKLMTRINDGFCRVVLEEFVAHGAPKEILTAAKPHIGTDLLRKVVVAIRQEIVSLGGEVRFHTAAEDIIAKDGKITGVIAQGEEIPCDCLILAPGNAARPLFTCSMERGIAMEAKPFSVGARIEHPQEAIDHAMYGGLCRSPQVGTCRIPALGTGDRYRPGSVYLLHVSRRCGGAGGFRTGNDSDQRHELPQPGWKKCQCCAGSFGGPSGLWVKSAGWGLVPAGDRAKGLCCRGELLRSGADRGMLYAGASRGGVGQSRTNLRHWCKSL